MATIDSNIALGVKPIQIENPMNQYAALSQLQANQNQNALAQYQLSAAQRADEAQNVQNQLYAKHYNAQTNQINEPAFLADLAAQNQGSLIPKAQAQFAEQKYKENQGKKIVSEIGKLDFDLGTNIFTQAQNELKQIDPRSPDAPAQFLAWRERQFANPALKDFFKNTGMTKEATDAQIKQAIRTPQGLADTILKSMTSADQFQKILNDRRQTDISAGNLNVSQARLKLDQDKAARDQTIGTIPAGYRLAADGQSLELIPGGPTAVALSPKEIQKREAVLPQAKQAVKTISNTMSVIGDTVDSLLANQNGINGITGLVYGNTPAISDAARKAKADLEQLKNLAFVQGITELRAASKTGAGVGNVTNREGDRFENLKASLDRTQSKEDLISALKKLKQQAEITSQYTNDAFNETYDYRNNAGVTQPTSLNPVAPVPSNTKKPSLNEIFSSPPKQ
jgi:hypothetical protein